MAKQPPPITPGNDYLAERDVKVPNAATGNYEAATGETGWLFWFAATKDGVAIHATLSKTATERTAKPGRYYAVFDGDDIETHIVGTYTTVWLLLGDSENVLRSARIAVRDTQV